LKLVESGARQEWRGWVYQGGQICAKAKLFWQKPGTFEGCPNSFSYEAESETVCYTCPSINAYVSPSSPFLPNTEVKFLFTSNYAFTNIGFNPGGGAQNVRNPAFFRMEQGEKTNLTGIMSTPARQSLPPVLIPAPLPTNNSVQKR
jgi:hypothetical protein